MSFSPTGVGKVEQNQIVGRTTEERLMIALIKRHGPMQEADIARHSGLEIQLVCNILDGLEKDALLTRPKLKRSSAVSCVAINPDGAFSVGLKIGRRTSELVLMDFSGAIRASACRAYTHPLPEIILDFLQSELPDILDAVPAAQQHRVTGIGIAMPFELWNWEQSVGQFGSPDIGLADWKNIDIAAKVAELTKLPVYVQNDATSACRAELAHRKGPVISDFAYFFIGFFIGGGIVVDSAVYSGPTGNAGALGSLPIAVGRRTSGQLLDKVSLASLEVALTQRGIDPSPIWVTPNNWATFGPLLDQWIDDSAEYLAQAALSCCSVIDFEAIIIDGAFPIDVRSRLVEKTAATIQTLEISGLRCPAVLAGSVGQDARSVGAAILPISSRYLTENNTLPKAVVQRD